MAELYTSQRRVETGSGVGRRETIHSRQVIDRFDAFDGVGVEGTETSVEGTETSVEGTETSVEGTETRLGVDRLIARRQ